MINSDKEKFEIINDEINFAIILYVLKKYQNFILFSLLIVMLLCIFYVFQQPNIYRSTVELVNIEKSSTEGSSSGGSGMNAIAKLAGISLGGSNIKNPAAIPIAVIKSRDFFLKLIEVDNVFNNILFPQSTIISSSLDASSSFYTQDQVNEMLMSSINYPVLEKAYNLYQSNLSLTIDEVTNLIILSYDHQSAEFAAKFINLIIQNINNVSRDKDLREVESSLKYLYESLNLKQPVDISNSINQLIESQLKKKMLASISEFYIMEPISKPYQSNNKVAPFRIRIILLTLIGWLVFSISSVIAFHYFNLYFSSPDKKEA